MKPSIWKPVKPYRISQGWGVSRPEIYSQFGFTKHNGIDVALGTDSIVRCPFEGEVISSGWQPTGGGLWLGFLSDEEFDFDDGKRARILVDFLHLKDIKRHPGLNYKGQVGDVLAIANNTGFSTGPHTHIQPKRVIKTPAGLIEIDKNDANNSFDWTPYLNGHHAEDYGHVLDNLKGQVSVLEKVVELLKKLIIKKHG